MNLNSELKFGEIRVFFMNVRIRTISPMNKELGKSYKPFKTILEIVEKE